MSATIAERRAQLVRNRNARHIESFERTFPGATADEALECAIRAEAAYDYPMRDAFIAWAEQLESKNNDPEEGSAA